MRIGQRVVITGDHPHKGQAGEYIEDREISALRGSFPVVRLDSGIECFVFEPGHWNVFPVRGLRK